MYYASLHSICAAAAAAHISWSHFRATYFPIQSSRSLGHFGHIWGPHIFPIQTSRSRGHIYEMWPIYVGKLQPHLRSHIQMWFVQAAAYMAKYICGLHMWVNYSHSQVTYNYVGYICGWLQPQSRLNDFTCKLIFTNKMILTYKYIFTYNCVPHLWPL